MKRYGEMKFADIVATSDNLVNMIKCVDKFPDFSVTPVGCVVQLSAPQAGYVTGHVYICEQIPGGSKYWRDLTISTDLSPDTTGQTFNIVRNYSGDKLTSVDMYWTTPTSGALTDPWVKDVVVMQPKRSPLTPDDGLQVISSVQTNEYTSSKKYHLIANRTTEENIFRVFHVFASGATTYTDPT